MNIFVMLLDQILCVPSILGLSINGAVSDRDSMPKILR